VAIAIIAGYAFLELDMGEMCDQLRENGPASIHPSLFRRYGVPVIRRSSLADFQFKSFLPRTLVIPLRASGLSDSAKYFTGHP